MTFVNKRFFEAFVALFAFFMLQTESLVIAQETGSHVHGLTELNIVVVNRDLQIEFVSPAINLLGFERESTSPEETELLNEVVSKLQTAEWLLDRQIHYKTDVRVAWHTIHRTIQKRNSENVLRMVC